MNTDTELTMEERFTIADWLQENRPEFMRPDATRGRRTDAIQGDRTVIHVKTTAPRDRHGEPKGELYPRETHTALDLDIYRASLATSRAPGLPINRRRRRKSVLTALMGVIFDALP